MIDDRSTLASYARVGFSFPNLARYNSIGVKPFLLLMTLRSLKAGSSLAAL